MRRGKIPRHDFVALQGHDNCQNTVLVTIAIFGNYTWMLQLLHASGYWAAMSDFAGLSDISPAKGSFSHK